MGDTNAVSVLELAHRRQLINAGVLRTDSLLLLERPETNSVTYTAMIWCSSQPCIYQG